MVCAQHKDVPKAKIEKYRALRRSEKITGTAAIATKRGPARRRKPVSPKVAKTRKLQGKYLGSLRALNATDKAKVKRVAKEKGVAEAVKAAGQLANAAA
jgi:hypothetical protein